MIIRRFGMRQGRQFLALSFQPRISTRFSSTQTSVDTAIRSHNKDGSEPQIQDSSKSAVISEEERQSEQAAWQALQEQSRRAESLGTEIRNAYDPDNIVKTPPRAADVTLAMLLASQTHMGHSTSRWNPQNSRYIFGIREGIHIIALDQTAAYLRRAARVVEEVAVRGGIILFVGTRPGQKESVVKAAEIAKGYHVFERWVAGTLTNSQQILGHCERKVVNALDDEIPELKETLMHRKPLQPDLVVVLNPVENDALLHECALCTIPTIGIIDTDSDPTRVTYQIPANDDSLRSTSLIAGVLGRAGEEGQRRRLAAAQTGHLTYTAIKAEELLTHPFTGESM